MSMTGRRSIGVSAVVVAGLILTSNVAAQTVTINGTAVSTSCGTNCINIEGTYGNVTISRISSTAPARVEVPSTSSDGTTDVLRLINARFHANAAVANFPIVFERQFVTGPSATSYYKVTSNGTFSPVAGNAINVKGFYTNPPAGTRDQTGNTLNYTVACDDTGCATSVNQKSGENYSPGITNRILRTEVLITLASGSDFNTGNGVKMSAPDQPDQPPDQPPCPTCKPKSELGFFCAMTYSTAKFSNCPSCVLDDEPKSQTAKLNNLIKTSGDNILEDMARGQGEHLASAATLLNIPASHRSAFFSQAQDQYANLSRHEIVTPEQLLSTLEEAWKLVREAS